MNKVPQNGTSDGTSLVTRNQPERTKFLKRYGVGHFYKSHGATVGCRAQSPLNGDPMAAELIELMFRAGGHSPIRRALQHLSP